MPSDSNGQTVWISHLYLNLQCFKWSTGFQSFPPSQLVPKLLCSIHASNTNLPPPCCSLSLSHRSSLHTISSIKSSLSSYVGKCKARCSLFLSFSFSFSLHLRWHRLLWKCVDANPFFSLSLSLPPLRLLLYLLHLLPHLHLLVRLLSVSLNSGLFHKKKREGVREREREREISSDSTPTIFVATWIEQAVMLLLKHYLNATYGLLKSHLFRSAHQPFIP